MLYLTKTQLISFNPCDLSSRLKRFGDRTKMNVEDAFAAGFNIGDILWVAGRLGRKDLIVRFALLSAQRVAGNNSDPRVQAALDAAKAWIVRPSPDTESATRSAAWAARSAAESAARSAAESAARSAAWAARSAAESAAWAATWAATESAAWAARSATESAAWAARSAAARAEIDAQKKIAIEVFS